jgi:hypothetical protein
MIGLAVTVAHLALIPIDGCSVNPARSFGAALVVGAFPDHYRFWAGPMLGAAVAAFVYPNLRVLREKEGDAWAGGEEGEEAPGSRGGGIALLRPRAGTGAGTPQLGAAHGANPVPPSPTFVALPAPALPPPEPGALRGAEKSLTISQRLEVAAGNRGNLARGGERLHVGAPAWAAGGSERRPGVKEW